MAHKLENIVQKFSELNVLVIGDAMLDTYLHGTSNRICREAPVPIVDTKFMEEFAGGAANTAVNCATLGADISFLSVLGNDESGVQLLKLLSDFKIRTDGIIVDPDRKTLDKQRIISNGQLLVRYDSGSTGIISEIQEDKIANQLIKKYKKVDAIIVSDYGYGVLTDRIIETIRILQERIPKILIVDSKYLDKYKDTGVTLAKPNFMEAVSLLGLTKPEVQGKRAEQISEYREELLNRTGAQNVAVTVDIEGAVVIGRNGLSYRTYSQQVADSRAAGAGDTYSAGFGLALGAGADVEEAAEIASAAASLIVQKEGTAICTQNELIRFFTAGIKFITDKEVLAEVLQSLRKNRKRIVFTNGCFDILHSGHVNYLNQAKLLGDVLVVGVNTDKSINKLKGDGRPLNNLVDRVKVLSGLSSIDYIVPFDEQTPVQLVEFVKPEIYTKGGDYTEKQLPEAQVVKKHGGEIVILPFISGYSTTGIIERMEKPQAHTRQAL